MKRGMNTNYYRFRYAPIVFTSWWVTCQA